VSHTLMQEVRSCAALEDNVLTSMDLKLTRLLSLHILCLMEFTKKNKDK